MGKPADRCVSKRLPSGAVTRHTFTPNQWLQVIDTLGPTGTVLARTTYTYDRIGNRIGEVGLDRLRTTWVYDRLYQLTDDHRMAAGVRYRASFEYDLAGNRTFNGRLSIPNVTFAYDAADRLISSRTDVGPCGAVGASPDAA